MVTKGISVETIRGRIALAFVAFALLIRILIPAGFMPETGKGFAITLCTGTGAVPAWVDEHGQVHKGKPASDTRADHPCGFAAAGAALDLSGVADGLILPFTAPAALASALGEMITIGHGLAAPPPPSTGPPSTH